MNALPVQLRLCTTWIISSDSLNTTCLTHFNLTSSKLISTGPEVVIINLRKYLVILVIVLNFKVLY